MEEDNEKVMSSRLQFPKISTDGSTFPIKANKLCLPGCSYTKRQPVSKKMVGQRRNNLTLAALTQNSTGLKDFNRTAKKSSLPGWGFQKCQLMVQHLAGKPTTFVCQTAVRQKRQPECINVKDSEKVMSSRLQFPKISTDGSTFPMKANKLCFTDCGYTQGPPVSKMAGQRINNVTLAAVTRNWTGVSL